MLGSSRPFPLPIARIAPLLRNDGTLLLETGFCDAENFFSYCFLDPVAVLTCSRPEELIALLATAEEHRSRGRYLAGYFGYACGKAFESFGRPYRASGSPIARIGVYDAPIIFDHRSGRFDRDLPPGTVSPDPPAPPSDLRLDIPEEDFCRDIAAIQCRLRDGDTYQINYTTRYTFSYHQDPLNLYALLRLRQRVPFAAFLRHGSGAILSFSPELFFRVDRGTITARPMKGTAPRGRTNAEDGVIADALAHDPKSRAENLMIVDLLRNDLGRLCQPGSVRTSDLFSVERYETLQQMTSTIRGTLRAPTGLPELFRALFPCGSVTGAPKISSMEIIENVERHVRGVYTGAIGFASPDGGAVFSVAIRTIELNGEQGVLGVGGGIVADSEAHAEFEECRLKGAFLTEQTPDFALLETMLWDGGFPRLEAHIARILDSGSYFRYPVDEASLRHALANLARTLAVGKRYRVRLTVDRAGSISLASSALADSADNAKLTTAFSPYRTDSSDRFFYHKTTHRPLYDREFARAQSLGHADLLFLNERGEVAEGAISTIFVRKQGMLFTPPLTAGILNGVFRQSILRERADAAERVLMPDDLLSAEALFLGNAVRGLREVVLTGGLDTGEK